ncbi:hypothetical protein [Arthrobacter sp. UCD-GKA]|uniref:hypothetical protein n=1 Tax=Arthrobacter sp. UCD-GKA TaxID=1913576 RepID=UPI001113D419|nr:hypothetical protein [Arthrobacter sp. UCD-GKA]
MSADLSGAMPAPVVGGSGITAATGDLDWAEGPVVARNPSLPWVKSGGWPPSANDRVEISAGYGGVEAKQLTGKIRGTSGSFAADDKSSSVEDDIAKLQEELTFWPLLDAMPSETDGVYPRYISLLTSYVVDRVARACGFYATPRRSVGSIMSAPMMGSTWPEWGTLESSINTDSALAYPRWTKTTWGVAVNGVNAVYRPVFLSGENGYLDKPMEVTLCLPSDTSGTCYVAVWWQGQVGVRLNITANSIIGQVQNPAAVTVCQTGRVGARTVTLRVVKNGTNLDFELRTDNGLSATGTAPIPEGTWYRPVDQVRVFGTGTFGGVQVAFPGAAFSLLGQVPTAKIEVAASDRNALQVMPAIVRQKGMDILRSLAEAECAEMWIDADGVFRWVDRTVMIARPSVATLTAAENIIDAQWEDNADAVRRDVTVAWKEPEVTRGWWASIDVYEGSGETLQPGEPNRISFNPPADETWVMVDMTVKRMWQSDLSAFNRGYGSWTGGVILGDAYSAEATASNLAVAFKEGDPNEFTMTHTASNVPAGSELQLRATNNPASALRSNRLGSNLPRVRARGRGKLNDRTTKGVPTGPANAEPFTHDAGHWIQTPEQAQALANYLAEATKQASPTIRTLEIIPDPRIERGDVVTIEDKEGSRLRVTGIVSSTQLDVRAGDMNMSIGLRVLTAAIGWPTLGERDFAWTGKTLEQFDAYWAGKTLAQYDADPLSKP